MKAIITTFFITAVCALPSANPYREQQTPIEIHTNSCECIADTLTIPQCCIEASGVIDAAFGRCNFSDKSYWSQFKECCTKYKGSTLCESKSIVEGQGRYNGHSDYHQKSDDEHERDNVQEDKSH